MAWGYPGLTHPGLACLCCTPTYTEAWGAGGAGWGWGVKGEEPAGTWGQAQGALLKGCRRPCLPPILFPSPPPFSLLSSPTPERLSLQSPHIEGLLQQIHDVGRVLLQHPQRRDRKI